MSNAPAACFHGLRTACYRLNVLAAPSRANEAIAGPYLTPAAGNVGVPELRNALDLAEACKKLDSASV